eukprot:scaffold5.g877.t1
MAKQQGAQAAPPVAHPPLRTLLIDNYDSYTYNLFQLIAEVSGVLPTVLRNDEVPWEALAPRLAAGEFHNIVVSPGPGTPERASDVGVVQPLLGAGLPIPTLGICLGFQALAAAHGGVVRHAPEPVHGRLCGVTHAGHPLFAGIPSGPAFQVVRYHSLVVEEGSLPACLQGIAWTCGAHHALALARDAGATPLPGGAGGSCGAGDAPLLMAVAHCSLPQWGVQFHPESIATGYGAALLHNFRDLTCAFHGLPAPPPVAAPVGPPGRPLPPRPWAAQGAGLRVVHRALPSALAAVGGSEALFLELFACQQAPAARHDGSQQVPPPPLGSGSDSQQWQREQPARPSTAGAEDTFWLDSSATDRGRFSFMGGRGGPLWRRVTYKLPSLHEYAATAAEQPPAQRPLPGTLVLADAAGRRWSERAALLPWLERQMSALRCAVDTAAAEALPFNFWGGFVGYWGYELKAECGGRTAHASALPDAAFFLADRLVAVDHRTGTVYVLALHEADGAGGQSRADAVPAVRAAGATEAEARTWVDGMVAQIQQLAERHSRPPQKQQSTQQQQQHQQANGILRSSSQQRQANGSLCSARAANGSTATAALPPFRLREGRQQYLANVAACKQALYEGESYEVCLTTELRRSTAPDPLSLYCALRDINPAPYAAWLHLGPEGPQVCCSSPERFLRGDRGGLLEARPIKGTAPRRLDDPAADVAAAAALAASEKDRAENLMIVDLLRNDLGRVCEPGSVHVPSLMAIESYATVHQMVSAVAGLRRADASVVDCLAAAFPGGSMTGAPKVRTMEILDRLEGGPRGIYSGSIGYMSLNDTFDLNIVIRSAVVHAGGLSIGAGGAIVVQSDPQGEYDEMRLKAAALLRAVGRCDAGGSASAEAAEVDES